VAGSDRAGHQGTGGPVVGGGAAGRSGGRAKIVAVVRNHNGDSQDVRSIIDDLHVQSTLTFNGV